MREVKPFPGFKVIKLLTLIDNLFPSLDIFAIKNPKQNDDGYHVFPPK